MRGVRKTLIAAIAVLMLAIGLAACGGGGDDSSSTASTAATLAEGGSGAGDSAQATDKEGAQPADKEGTGKEGNPGSDGQPADGSGSSSGSGSSGNGSGSGGGNGSGGSSGSRKKASEFVPKQHSDSGGGSSQYTTKGGDNSVQEYGQEAAGSEFGAAATALHNFLDSRAEENWAASCEYLAKTAQEGLQKLAARAKPGTDTSCGAILQALIGGSNAMQTIKAEADEADVRSVRIEGERGFVLFTAMEGGIYSMPMLNEGGAWKVTSLGGSRIG